MASSNSPKARFVWNENLNGVFLREVVFHKPYQFRSGTKESAGCWVKLCAKLTGDDNKVYGFVGHPKAFRDHFNLLVNKRKQANAAEERSMGDDYEEKEIDLLLDDIIADISDWQGTLSEQAKENKENEGKEKEKAEYTRQKAMESISETKKRKNPDGDDVIPKKTRRSGSDVFNFLAERNEQRGKEREEDLALRREELKQRASESESSGNAMVEMMRTMQQQQQQQMQFQQQQQQMQMQLFSALIDKLNK